MSRSVSQKNLLGFMTAGEADGRHNLPQWMRLTARMLFGLMAASECYRKG
ncbi:hypothetical protein SAMN02745161_1294 [Halodesulfovibrio marinisediminis DSM 17456]|uniref:Uncharacterized protein n=1 Tax=Halodesulfovibrio marinisediminis DSM 17456 TaxID=1121457 RepID=A0A1N6FFY5_9BACT|nr:hypothetical protein SAMN02745161_1294 [Halodesulfovibrio marinisediminis DSM 17456]